MSAESRVHSLYIASPDDEGLEKQPLDRVEVTHEGFKGDKHAGFLRKADARTPQYPKGELIRNDRQWSAVTMEELEAIADAMGVPLVEAAWLGANLALSSIRDFTSLPKGSKLHFPDRAVLVVEEENMPCVYPGKVITSKYPEQGIEPNTFPKASIHKRGVVGVVERTGTISKGDPVKVEVFEAKKYFYGEE